MSVCESSEWRVTDTENTDTVHVESASYLDAETVQNSSNVRSCHVEEESLSDSDLLKGMLTDTFCQVCEAVLLFESQRVSHYEGKKHAQRVRIHLQTKKAERSKQRQEHTNILSIKDPEKFCELCNMVFSSPVVARSHYEGKVHAKNMRKVNAAPSVDSKTTACPLVLPVPTEEDPREKEVVQEQKSSASAVQRVDLSDPDKYCKMCAASFNNPLMAQQHYSGRKHQRNQTRQQMLNQLSEKSEQASSLSCPLCCVTLDSVEMYQDHMQGNKHHVKEKTVTGLCKKKVYDSFQDELADYIQVQRARGLEPKTAQASEVQEQGKADEQESDSEENEEKPQDPANPAHLSHPAFRLQHWRPPFYPQPNQTTFSARFPVHQQWNQGCSTYPPPLIPGLTGRSLHKWKRLNSSSSSSFSDSSLSSSSSSDSSSSENRRRRRRKRRAGTKGGREEENSGEERRRSKKRRKGEEMRRSQGKSSENEQKKRREGKRSRERVSKEKEGYKKQRKGNEWSEQSFDVRTTKGEEAVLDEGGMEEPMFIRAEPKEDKPKHRKEKKKTKDAEDSRTEEEKLWDETILGIF